MKRVIGWFISSGLILIFLLAFPSQALAQNKLGVNIAARYREFEEAAQLVGSGGWVTIMASPGNAPELNQMLSTHPEVNIILRGHCPSDPLGPIHEANKEFALTWAATLGGIDTAGRKIYFMPWNEPNMTRECGGLGDDFDPNNTDCAPYVVEYIKNLKKYFAEAGILGKKAELISPMINQHHANYKAFIAALGGRSFFDQFAGVTMNLYHHESCGEAYCDVARYGEVLSSVGLGGMKVFAAEMGIIAPSGSCPPGVSDCPIFEDSRMRALIEQVYPIWKGDANFVMFSPLSYNPETNDPSWIYGGSTAAFYKAQPKGGSPPSSAGFDLAAFLAWRAGQPVSECGEGMEGAFAPNQMYCGKCGAALGKVYRAPIGYLDQMNITAEGKFDPFDTTEWYWARCFNPSTQTWDMNCVEALNKMGVPQDGLYYPLWLKEWRDYTVNTVLPRRTPYHLQKEVVEYAQNEDNFHPQGWIEFVTSGENHETKRTQITNPRAMLFGPKFVGQLSYATDWIWRSFTGFYDQPKKPILTRDGRDQHLGYSSPNNDPVHFGSYSPAPGLFAADKVKGSCIGKNPNLDCGAPGHCSKHCCKERAWITPIYSICLKWRDEKDEYWTMRQINPEVNAQSNPELFGHDNIETLNPGWPELANAWNNIANPINGFIPAVARKHDLDVNMGDDCPDLFADQETLEKFSQAPDPIAKQDLNICSWRYANTAFSYLYGPKGGMKTHGCAAVLDPKTPGESRESKTCLAHWPFVGGLNKVKDFIIMFTHTFKQYALE